MDQPGNIRPPAVAGKFYPADPVELRNQVTDLLSRVQPAQGPAPKAVIAPHAGYIYSGPIAASAYARFIPGAETIRRVVLLGPAHYAAFPGLALPSVEAFATPLGVVPLDLEAVRQLLSLAQVKVHDAAHAPEHCLEVQLPFLQVLLREFKIVPLVVGDAGAEEIQQVLDLLWGGPETRFVISSDLSHYHDSQTARHLDRATAGAIEALAPERIGTEQACGFGPVRGLLQAARRHGLRARAVDLRNSGDTAGPRHQVVGYGAFAFEESAEAARIAG
jgi:MEMO1 family protein